MQPEVPQHSPRQSQQGSNMIWAAVAAGVLAVAGIGMSISSSQQTAKLASNQAAISSTLEQMQRQMQVIADQQTRLRETASTPTAPPVVEATPEPVLDPVEPAPKPAKKKTVVVAKKQKVLPQPPPEDPRWKEMQSKLSEQDSKIASTQQMVEDTRKDFDGKLGSTKDELNGNIARTHEEVVALQRRGERDYVEFTISKSKEFQRVGPLSLALRKTDTKHKRFNLDMMVDDNKLEKKNVNLHEPVYTRMSDRPQAVEVVVNSINKDVVKGYVSTPKYKISELSSTQIAPRPKLAEETASREE